MHPRTTMNATTFLSPRCARPIPVTTVPMHSALIWASLDGSVSSIDVETVTRSRPVGSKEYVLLETASGTSVIDVVPEFVQDAEDRHREEAAWRAFGWAPITLLPSEIEKELRFANARRIWRHRRVRVPSDLRIQIIGRLYDDGPQPLSELLPSLRADCDPLPVIYSLACGDEVEIDLVDVIGPQTVVRHRV